MELRDIEYFAAIAEHGNLGRAAEVLEVGQPALSMSLRRLERLAQAKLVQRTPRGVELTAVGRALLAHVQRLRLAHEDLAREIADLAHGRTGDLRIGASPSITESLLPQACTALFRDAPEVAVIIQQQDNEALLPAVRDGELDLALIQPQAPPPTEIEQLTLRNDEFVVYCSARHRLARRRSVKLGELVEEKWACTPASAVNGLQRVFKERGLPPPRLRLISDSVALRLQTVAGSGLLGLASSSVVRRAAPLLDLVTLRVVDQKWSRSIAIAYRKGAYLPPSAMRFIEILRSI